MGLKFEYVIKGKSFQTKIAEIAKIKELSMQELEQLSNGARDKMVEFLNEGRKRGQRDHSVDQNPEASKEKIEDNIKVEPIETENGKGFGVGKISDLDKNSPHWKAQNWGSGHLIDPANKANHPKGKFEWFGSGSVFYQNASGWWTTMKKPIEAKLYIERTVQWMGNEFSKIIAKLQGVR